MNTENLNKLTDKLERTPDQHFNMNFYSGTMDGKDVTLSDVAEHKCGTVACIAGWCGVLDDVTPNFGSPRDAIRWLGVPAYFVSDEIFYPFGYTREAERARLGKPLLYPRTRAIAMLKNLRDQYLTTGEIIVDWDAQSKPEYAHV